MNFIIRREQPEDYREVEELAREAFWNLFTPGCDEHLLTHKLRDAAVFIPQLDLVAVQDGRIIGNIIYTHSAVVDSDGVQHKVITFGPISVLPGIQKQGVGTALIEQSKKLAQEMGFSAIVIMGNPEYYHRFGFRTAKEFGIQLADGTYMPAHMVMELYEGALKGVSGKFIDDPVFIMDRDEVEEFDKSFPPKEKLVTQSQRDFEILAAQRL